MAAAEARGKKALEAKDFPLAIKEFTAAIKELPRAPSYHWERSSAYLRAGQIEKALIDAEAAVFLAKSRDRADFIAKAQFRRAVALYTLGRYKDAQKCFAWSKEKDPSEKTLAIWDIKVNNKLEAGEGPDATVQQWPDESALQQARGEESNDGETKVQDSKAITSSTSTTTTNTAKPSAPVAGVVSTPSSQIRHDWYQSADSVTLSLMVKGVPKDKAVVEMEKTSISISFPLPTGSDYNFSLDPLYSAIDPSASTYKVLSTKVELILKKAVPGTKWHTLEGTATADTNDLAEGPKPIPAEVIKGPSYPTSSKSGPKDWDKLATDLSKTKTDADGKPLPEGKGDLDDEEGDPTNAFFKMLYKNSDPDTRRAMMKSYQESNGTVLSTNWSEVGSKKQEIQPPDGMEVHKYEY